MKPQYGLNGDMTALDWLELGGRDAIAELRHRDYVLLQQAGIINENGSLNEEQLALALKYRTLTVRYNGEDTLEAYNTTDPRIAGLQTVAHEPTFGVSPTHPFALRLQ